MENIIFDTTKNLQITLKEISSTLCDITVNYVDVSSSGVVVGDGAQESRSNGNNYVTILSNPSGTNVRNALTVTVVNNDTVPHTFYIYKVLISGPTYYLVTEQTLFPGKSWDSNLSVNNTFDMAAAISNATPDNLPIPASTFGFVESNTLRNMTLLNLVGFLQAYLPTAYPFMSNGIISPTVAGNNLTLALKTLAGSDPTSNNPVTISIGGLIHLVSSPLSVTVNAGTNTFNAGAAELKMQAIDYFAYLGYNVTDGVTIGFARVPYFHAYSEMNTTASNEHYCTISTITHAAATDPYVVIGRFEATNSGSSSYTWSVPTYTPINLVQYPIVTTRRLTWVPQFTGFSTPPTHNAYYEIINDTCLLISVTFGNGTSNATTFTESLPFQAGISSYNLFTTPAKDNGAFQTNFGHAESTAGSNTLSLWKTWFEGPWTASGIKDAYMPSFMMYLK